MAVKIEGIDKTMAYIRQQAEKRARDYIEVLNRIGLKVVGQIRTGEVSRWDDQTGNLRSSIGYIIVDDGMIVKRGGFEKVDGPKRDQSSPDGSAEGQSFAEELASKYPKGYCLIIVAGMEYAAYVEAIENKTVLAGGKLLAEKLHKELCAKLAAKWDSKTS